MDNRFSLNREKRWGNILKDVLGQKRGGPDAELITWLRGCRTILQFIEPTLKGKYRKAVLTMLGKLGDRLDAAEDDPDRKVVLDG